MGQRLAKDVQAIFEAKVDQDPMWHRAIAEGGLNTPEVIEFLLGLSGALREAIVYLAGELPDPSRAKE